MNGVARYDDTRKIYETSSPAASQGPAVAPMGGGNDLFSQLVARMMSKRRPSAPVQDDGPSIPNKGKDGERDLWATSKANWARMPAWVEYSKQQKLLDRPGDWRFM